MTRLLTLLLLTLAMGGCGMFGSDSPKPLQNALSDEQTRAQVVDPAVAVVRAVTLDDVTGGFTFGSCTDQGEPPFQGRVEVTFKLPADPEPVYAQIRDALAAQGWTQNAPDDQPVHGGAMQREGVTATVGPRAADPGYGTLQFFGECRNAGEHGSEGAVDITGELR